jgi:hypothetical protein
VRIEVMRKLLRQEHVLKSDQGAEAAKGSGSLYLRAC